MAQLPPNGEWLVQQQGDEVVVFHRDTEEEVVRFDATNGDLAAKAQKIIHDSLKLSTEQKAFASFWSGYFYAHSVSKAPLTCALEPWGCGKALKDTKFAKDFWKDQEAYIEHPDGPYFRDQLSAKEFRISGLCQDCQDLVFGKDD